MFNSIIQTGSITITTALICTAVSILLGLAIATVSLYTGGCSKNFAVTLVMLPVIVQIVIMMVNGNLGTGVAVVGAFSLIRFRSVAGNSKDICIIFFAMAIGLATGMGYVSFAVMAAVIICLIFVLLYKTRFGEVQAKEKELKVTIPENLDYTGIFDDIFHEFAKKASLERVKTTNLGSMFELSYRIEMKDLGKEKEMIDAIRSRNGNLTVICGKVQLSKEEL